MLGGQPYKIVHFEILNIVIELNPLLKKIYNSLPYLGRNTYQINRLHLSWELL